MYFSSLFYLAINLTDLSILFFYFLFYSMSFLCFKTSIWINKWWWADERWERFEFFFEKIEQNTKFNDENKILTKYNYFFEFSVKKQKNLTNSRHHPSKSPPTIWIWNQIIQENKKEKGKRRRSIKTIHTPFPLRFISWQRRWYKKKEKGNWNKLQQQKGISGNLGPVLFRK